MDKFAEKMDAIIAHLSILVGYNVKNDEEGVRDAMHCLLEHGTTKDVANGIMMVSEWCWAHCEEEYHAGTMKDK